MEKTYTILGADGQHYGPVPLENLRAWLREGRVTAATQVLRSDQNTWLPASSYAELGLGAAPVIPVNTPSPVATPVLANTGEPETVLANPAEIAQLESRIRSGASWFYWIAAFSVINSVLANTKNSVGFALGLSITQFSDRLLRGVPGASLILGILAAAGLVVLGIYAHRKQTWAFLVGVILYGLDTALTILVAVLYGPVWISVGIHAWALISLILGLRASLKYRQLLRNG